MRAEITTIEIAERFGKLHKNVLQVIRSLTINDKNSRLLFSDCEYTTSQNKKLESYKMGVNGFSVMSNNRMFSSGDSAYVKATILNEFGEKFTVHGFDKKRSEDLFYEKLKRFMPNQQIIRQYPIGKYKIDFYLADCGLMIEYDESYHSAKSTKKQDQKRFDEINRYLKRETDNGISMVRVKSSNEEAGLMLIVSYMSDLFGDSICKYYESYSDEHPEYISIDLRKRKREF